MRVHSQKDEDSFPENGIQTLTAALKEAVRDGDQATIESAAKHLLGIGSSDRRPFFFRNDHSSKEVWKVALQDPNEEMIHFLISLTSFESSNAQRYILEEAVTLGNKELVKWFTADEYRDKRSGGTTILWDRAVEAAIKRDDDEALEILLEAALRNLDDGTKRRGDKRLREFCIRACRMGSLSCLQHFVSSYSVDPFSHSKIKTLTPTTLDFVNGYTPASDIEKLWYRRSVLYHAIETGNKEIFNYLQQFLGDTRFSHPEPSELLLQVATVNGYDSILVMLAVKDLNTDAVESFFFKSQLHLALRLGKKELAKCLIKISDPLDFPDLHFCTPVMYAAYHGFEDIVAHLIQKGVNVDQLGFFQIEGKMWSRKLCDGTSWTFPLRAKDLAEKGGHKRIYDLLEDASKLNK